MNGPRQELAVLWRRILRADPPPLLVRNGRLKNRGEQDGLPQPGYVGRNYQLGGLTLIALNPGPDRTGLGRADLEQYEALGRLKEADDDHVLARFEDLMSVLERVMLEWRIIQNKGLLEILASKQMTFADVAYTNIAKWRTIDDPRKRELDESWKLGTEEQFMLLRPSRVILLGQAVADWMLSRKHLGDLKYDVIPRHIGDTSMTPRAREVVAQICAENWRPSTVVRVGGERPLADLARSIGQEAGSVPKTEIRLARRATSSHPVIRSAHARVRA
jgi:hypothetical protein